MPEGTRGTTSRPRAPALHTLNSGWVRGVSELGASGKLSGGEGFAAGLVDHRQVGLIGLDCSGVIVQSNDRGREILSREDGLRDQSGRLRAQRPEDVEALESLLESVLASDIDDRVGGWTAVGRWPEQRPLTVYVSRVGGGQAGVAAVVVVVDPWQPTRLSPEQVAASLRLTPAESRVAVALAEGLTIGQIAEATGRTVPTVRSLVQRALEKTYCSRQAHLVRLVLSSSHLPLLHNESSGIPGAPRYIFSETHPVSAG